MLRRCRRALTVCRDSLFSNNKPVCVDHEWDDRGRYLSRRLCEPFVHYCRSDNEISHVRRALRWGVSCVWMERAQHAWHMWEQESLEESFVLLCRWAQSETSAGWGRGTAPGGGTETVLVFSGADVCCCVGDVGFVQPVAGRWRTIKLVSVAASVTDAYNDTQRCSWFSVYVEMTRGSKTVRCQVTRWGIFWGGGGWGRGRGWQ